MMMGVNRAPVPSGAPTANGGVTGGDWTLCFASQDLFSARFGRIPNLVGTVGMDGVKELKCTNNV